MTKTITDKMAIMVVVIMYSAMLLRMILGVVKKITIEGFVMSSIGQILIAFITLMCGIFILQERKEFKDMFLTSALFILFILLILHIIMGG